MMDRLAKRKDLGQEKNAKNCQASLLSFAKRQIDILRKKTGEVPLLFLEHPTPFRLQDLNP
jgi:hypothetical protein